MPDRRTDELTALAIEYALFLADNQRLPTALAYLESCKGRSDALLRVFHHVIERRKEERRQAPRG